jgi:hypothetical protein
MSCVRSLNQHLGAEHSKIGVDGAESSLLQRGLWPMLVAGRTQSDLCVCDLLVERPPVSKAMSQAGGTFLIDAPSFIP